MAGPGAARTGVRCPEPEVVDSQQEVDVTAEPACRCNPQLARGNLKVLLCVAVVVSGIGAASPLPAAAQTIEPRWKLEAGTELVYRQSVQSETELPQGMGTSTMSMESTQRWSVLDVDGDGNATVRLTTEGARMRVGGPMETMSIGPAENESAGSPLDAMQALDGTSYTVVLDSGRETVLDSVTTVSLELVEGP